MTDIALRVVMGALCHPIGVDLDGDGAGGGAGDRLGLCAAEEAPVGNAPLTDGVGQGAGQFLNAFPYLTTPVPGSPSGAAGGMPMDADTMTGGADEGMNGGDTEGDGDGINGGDADGDGDSDGMAGGDADDDCPVDVGTMAAESLSGTELLVFWGAADADTRVIGYDVFVEGTLFARTEDPRILIEGLEPGTSHDIEVVPVDVDGNRFECLPILTLITPD